MSPKKPGTPAATKPPTKERKTQARDPRLPKVGATLSRTFKGKIYEAVVEHDGFRFAGAHWKSLTAIAKEITGYPSISGPVFWNLDKPAPTPHEEPKAATPAPTKRKAGRPISKKRGG